MSHETMYCIGGPLDGYQVRVPSRTMETTAHKIIANNLVLPPTDPFGAPFEYVTYRRERFLMGQDKGMSVLMSDDVSVLEVQAKLQFVVALATMGLGTQDA